MDILVEPRGAVIFSTVAGRGRPTYTEEMPGMSSAYWASWCAFRLLHPVYIDEFDDEVDNLFEAYKKSKSTWKEYTAAKRALLRAYLSLPYFPGPKK